VLGRRPLRLGRVERHQTSHAEPFGGEAAGGDEPVAAVVSLTAHDESPATTAAPSDADRGARHGATGALHQHLDRRPRIDRCAIRSRHLVGTQERPHLYRSIIRR
jgi:hypothetical protein